MSLLLDALDRAERERREQAARGGAELSLEPTEGVEPPVQAIPTLSGGDARSLFNLEERVPLRRRSVLWGAGALLLGVGCAIVWWIFALQGGEAPPVQALPVMPPPSMPPPGMARNDAPAQSAMAKPIDTASGGTAAASAHPGGMLSNARRNDAVPASVAQAMPRQSGGSTARARSIMATAGAGMPSETPSAAAGTVGRKAVNAPSVDIRLFRTPEATQVDPALMAAWHALRAGKLDEARTAYQKLEQSQPTSVDVQLGLARIAAEQGQRDEARQHYRRALLFDPQNSTARGGLAVLEPVNAESPVDSQLRTNPDDPAAQAALGARLSAAGQWPEAEQAWFEALRGDPENPDLLYNLGVALDHLGQSSSAVRHYREALQAATRQRPHFDPRSVEQRLHALAAD